MSALICHPDGRVEGLYTEAIDLRTLGRLTLRRASTIEFDERTQVWWVRLAKRGRVFSAPTRAQCLAWEELYFATHDP